MAKANICAHVATTEDLLHGATDFLGKVKFTMVFPIVFHNPLQCSIHCNIPTSKLSFGHHLCTQQTYKRPVTICLCFLSGKRFCVSASCPSPMGSDFTLPRELYIQMVKSASCCKDPTQQAGEKLRSKPGALRSRPQAPQFLPHPPPCPSPPAQFLPAASAESQEVAAESLAYEPGHPQLVYLINANLLAQNPWEVSRRMF